MIIIAYISLSISSNILKKNINITLRIIIMAFSLSNKLFKVVNASVCAIEIDLLSEFVNRNLGDPNSQLISCDQLLQENNLMTASDLHQNNDSSLHIILMKKKFTNTVVGCLIVDLRDTMPYLEVIASTQQGVGRLLMFALEEWLLYHNRTQYFLHSRPSSEGFYEKLGLVKLESGVESSTYYHFMPSQYKTMKLTALCSEITSQYEITLRFLLTLTLNTKEDKMTQQNFKPFTSKL